MEKKTIKALKSLIAAQGLHENFEVTDSELIIPIEKPFIAATPDSIVTSKCHGYGVLEIKCPYHCRDLPIRVAAQKSNFPLIFDKETGIFAMRQSHNYYFQVQLQMYVAKAEFFIFAVYTNVDLVHVTVLPDVSLIEKMLIKAKLYFCEVVLPQVLAKNFTESNSNALVELNNNMNPCLCGETRDEKQYPVASCANADCLVRVFHKACVKTKVFRKGWLCTHCRSETNKLKAKARRDALKENVPPQSKKARDVKNSRLPLRVLNK